ncbi:helix-turn-helix domain-containing protein [Arthrobacter jiangjiafuii]|uniref:AraC-like ligand-binding domain-containing protein n=1 Tax=Arthrobacter jiangjiafuii TaxID=2817475 RepID=UPI001F00DD68|nr:helix-turn-helix domain-containing protein [Arthrobacter jiangjiafuii]
MDSTLLDTPGQSAAAGPVRATTFAAWKRLISDSFVPLETIPAPGRRPDDHFEGQLLGRRLREMAIVRVEAQAHTVVRTPELAAAADQGYYKLNLQISGRGALEQAGREIELSPGDLAIYDTQQPYTLRFAEDMTTLVLMFPKQLLNLAAEDLSDLTAIRLGAGHPVGSAVVPFLTRIAALLPDLDGPIGHRLAMNTVDLLATMLAAESYSGRVATGHERMLPRIKHFIEGQLANPELSPGYIASAHYISTRSLHKLFEDSGTTAAAWIRERRLDGARRDLADPLQADLPVATVGARWGLPDPAHFSRAFRTAYGCPPSVYRTRS